MFFFRGSWVEWLREYQHGWYAMYSLDNMILETRGKKQVCSCRVWSFFGAEIWTLTHNYSQLVLPQSKWLVCRSGSTIYPQSWADSMVTSISKSSEFHQLPYGPWGFHFLPFLVWNLTRHLRSFEFDLRLVATYLPKKIQPKNMTWRMLNEKHGEKKASAKSV